MLKFYLCMKIFPNEIKYQKQQPKSQKTLQFCARDLYNINLIKKTTKKPAEAKIVEFDHSERDKNLIYSLDSIWQDTTYMPCISYNYFQKLKNNSFIAVSEKNSENLKAKDIKSILQYEDSIIDGKKQCEIIYIQAAPEIANNKKAPVKGAGELIVWAAVKHAKQTGCEEVFLTSTNNGFYENIGFENCKRQYVFGNEFCLKSKDFDWFLKKTEKKYHLDCNI